MGRREQQIRKGEGRNAFNQLMLKEAATGHGLQIRASGAVWVPVPFPFTGRCPVLRADGPSGLTQPGFFRFPYSVFLFFTPCVSVTVLLVPQS
jgi:hypothetical protein